MNEQISTPILADDERLDEVNEKIRLIQKKQGLTFGTDAYLLAAFIRPKSRAKAVDLGSGTGIIPLLLCAKEKVESVHAVEIQQSFADLIVRNAALNGFSERITPVQKDLRELNAEALGGEADLVCSNPPYLKANAGKTNLYEEKEIARHEIRGDIFDFCAAASRILKSKGSFYCVWRADRLTDLLCAMRQNRLEPKRMIFVHADCDQEPCLVLLEALKDAAPSLRVLPPLFLYEARTDNVQARTLTHEAERIYQTCSFPWELQKNNHKRRSNNHEEA
jgi:tRNA1Val (adenine37-N6)-methyltransferase